MFRGAGCESLVVDFVSALVIDIIASTAVNSANNPDVSLGSNCEGAFRFEINI